MRRRHPPTLKPFSIALQSLSLPEWVTTAVIVLVALGCPIALVLAWAFE
jgi:hypothetical protein